MKPSEALTAHRNELLQLVSHYGLSRPRVFGSALSGADTEDSDLDLLVVKGGKFKAVSGRFVLLLLLAGHEIVVYGHCSDFMARIQSLRLCKP